MFNIITGKILKMQNRMPRLRYYPNSGAEFHNGRQERLLKTVNSIAYCLFSMEKSDFSDVLMESLEKLGRSVNAERVVLWKNYMKKNNLRVMRYAKWNDPELEKRSFRSLADPVPDDFLIEEYLPDWETIMAEQVPVYFKGRDLQEPFRTIARKNGIRSVLIVPVFCMGNYWGFISLLTYLNEHLYSSSEKEWLRMGGALIASAIEHNETAKELIRVKEEAQKIAKAKSDIP